MLAVWREQCKRSGKVLFFCYRALLDPGKLRCLLDAYLLLYDVLLLLDHAHTSGGGWSGERGREGTSALVCDERRDGVKSALCIAHVTLLRLTLNLPDHVVLR